MPVVLVESSATVLLTLVPMLDRRAILEECDVETVFALELDVGGLKEAKRCLIESVL